MRKIAVVMSLLFSFLFTSLSHASPSQIVQLAQYIAGDYAGAVAEGQVINPAEFEEMREFSQRVVSLLAAEKTTKRSNNIQPLREQAEKLQQAVDAKSPATEVNRIANELAQQTIVEFNLQTEPKHMVDSTEAKKLYQANCLSCHGEAGDGNGPMAKNLNPKPMNFLDREAMEKKTLFSIYNSITLGVPDTAMLPFEKVLTEPQRWGVAAYILNLSKENQQKTFAMAGTMDSDASGPAETDSNGDHWKVIQTNLDDSWKHFESGDYNAAYSSALRAYLDGFEPLEPTIDTKNKNLRLETEHALMQYRAILRNNGDAAEVKAALDAAHEALEKAQAALNDNAQGTLHVLLSAMLILLREGLEMILVVAFVLAFLSKTERHHLNKHVHIGWLGAVAAGVVTWAASHYLLKISGVQREMAEGLAALLAAVVLLSVGFWLHRATIAQEWQSFIRNSLNKSLGSGSVFGLVSLVFIAVYREMFETILFYETLWLQTVASSQYWVIVGFVAALAILIGVVFALVKFGLKLPLQQFFKVSTALMFVLAIIFVGQGFHALEEAGKLPEISFNFLTIAPLGIYPSAISLGVQALLLVGVMTFVWMQKSVK